MNQATVYKYPIIAKDYFDIAMPSGAKILTVQVQLSNPCIWALVNPDNKAEIRRFRLAGTGHWINEDNLEYIGTFQISGGSLVFHLFEILPLQIEAL